MMRLALAAAVVTASSCASPPPDPAHRASAALEAAVAALGGPDRIRAARTWDVAGEGRENLSAEAQGITPGAPTWRPHQERVAVDAATLTVAWERRTPRNDGSLRWRRLIYGADSGGFVDLASGRGVMRAASTDEPARGALARRVPHLLLLEAAAAASRATWSGTRDFDGRPHDAIDIETADGAALTLFLSGTDPVALRRAEYRTHLPTRGDVVVGWDWLGWTADSALGMVPSGHRVEVDGTPFQQVAYTRYRAGGPVDSALGIGPAGNASLGVATGGGQPGAADEPVPPAAGYRPTGAVAPGVHVASIGGFGVMLVEFREFVVAVEAPAPHPGLERIPAAAAGSIAGDHLAWIRGIAGDRPLRYAVVSHHHSDHLGGARDLVAAGAALLVSPGDTAAARDALLRPHTLAGGPDVAVDSTTIEAVAATRTIDDGTRRLEVLQVGPNPHTAENLAVWLPRERILFQGDLFYYGAGQPFPPPGRGTMNRFFAGWLAERGLEPAAIYGVHNGGAAGPEALARARAMH